MLIWLPIAKVSGLSLGCFWVQLRQIEHDNAKAVPLFLSCSENWGLGIAEGLQLLRGQLEQCLGCVWKKECFLISVAVFCSNHKIHKSFLGKQVWICSTCQDRHHQSNGARCWYPFNCWRLCNLVNGAHFHWRASSPCPLPGHDFNIIIFFVPFVLTDKQMFVYNILFFSLPSNFLAIFENIIYSTTLVTELGRVVFRRPQPIPEEVDTSHPTASGPVSAAAPPPTSSPVSAASIARSPAGTDPRSLVMYLGLSLSLSLFDLLPPARWGPLDFTNYQRCNSFLLPLLLFFLASCGCCGARPIYLWIFYWAECFVSVTSKQLSDMQHFGWKARDRAVNGSQCRFHTSIFLCIVF